MKTIVIAQYKKEDNSYDDGFLYFYEGVDEFTYYVSAAKRISIHRYGCTVSPQISYGVDNEGCVCLVHTPSDKPFIELSQNPYVTVVFDDLSEIESADLIHKINQLQKYHPKSIFNIKLSS
jgi:hypothetical protein